MKKHVTILLIVSSAILLIAGCGGGGGGGTVQLCVQEWDYWSADTLNPPTSSNLVDTYTLTGFDIDVWEDGVFWGSLDATDFFPWSGTMDIQPTTVTQNITLEGDFFSNSGSYTVTTAGPTSGTFHITDPDGSYDFDFDISGNTLIWGEGLTCVAVPADQLGIEPLGVDINNHIWSWLGGRFMY